MGNRKGTKRTAAKKRAKVGDLTAKTKNPKGGTRSLGTASGFIPGAGVISAAISNAK